LGVSPSQEEAVLQWVESLGPSYAELGYGSILLGAGYDSLYALSFSEGELIAEYGVRKGHAKHMVAAADSILKQASARVL